MDTLALLYAIDRQKKYNLRNDEVVAAFMDLPLRFAHFAPKGISGKFGNCCIQPVTEYWYPDNSYVTTAYEDGVATITWKNDNVYGSSCSIRQMSPYGIDLVPGHVVYTSQFLKTTIEGGEWGVMIRNGRPTHTVVHANEWVRLSSLSAVPGSGTSAVDARPYYADLSTNNIAKTGDTAMVKKVMCVDVTAIYGAGNEPDLAGFERDLKLNGIDVNDPPERVYPAQDVTWWTKKPQTIKAKWNQIAPPIADDNYQPYNATNTSVTINDDIGTMTWLVGGTGYNYSTRFKVALTNNHTYFVSYMFNSELSAKFGVSSTGSVVDSWMDYEPTLNEWHRYSVVSKKTGSTGANYILAPYIKSSTAATIRGKSCQFKAVILVDLTMMYGAGNEPDLAEFERQCGVNNIDLTEYQTQDTTGTDVSWIVS